MHIISVDNFDIIYTVYIVSDSVRPFIFRFFFTPSSHFSSWDRLRFLSFITWSGLWCWDRIHWKIWKRCMRASWISWFLIDWTHIDLYDVIKKWLKTFCLQKQHYAVWINFVYPAYGKHLLRRFNQFPFTFTSIYLPDEFNNNVKWIFPYGPYQLNDLCCVFISLNDLLLLFPFLFFFIRSGSIP